MTIRNNEPLSMAEVAEFLGKDSETMKFIKKFTKTTPKEAREMRKKFEGMEIMKMKSDEISKIIDVMPENQEDLNKISWSDVSKKKIVNNNRQKAIDDKKIIPLKKEPKFYLDQIQEGASSGKINVIFNDNFLRT